MLILNSEDVRFCFLKTANSQILMGIKYRDWWFYSDQFLDKNSEEVDLKLEQWWQEKNYLSKNRIIVNQKDGFYLCKEKLDIEPISTSTAIMKLSQQMWLCQTLKKTLHHESWQISKQYWRGSDAITWMKNNLNISHYHALQLANRSIEQKVLSHFLGQTYFLDDEDQLYRPRKIMKIEPKYRNSVLSKPS